MASRTAAADSGRSSGFFASSRAIRADSPAGTSGFNSRTSSVTAIKVSNVLARWKGDTPVHRW